jgi:hypothetical protein
MENLYDTLKAEPRCDDGTARVTAQKDNTYEDNRHPHP